MFFVRLLSRLPFPILYLISDVLFIFGYRVFGYRKKMVRRNLESSFPEKSQKEIKLIEHSFYRNLCDYAVETLKLMTIKPEALKKRVVYKNLEIIEACERNNQSVLFLASHQFNWEWITAAGNLWLPLPADYVYQAQRSEFVNRFSVLTRGRFGSKAIKRSEVMRDIVRNKNKLRGYCNCGRSISRAWQ